MYKIIVWYRGQGQHEQFNDRNFRVAHNKCDICNDRLMCSDDIESQIDILNEIDDSYGANTMDRIISLDQGCCYAITTKKNTLFLVVLSNSF